MVLSALLAAFLGSAKRTISAFFPWFGTVTDSGFVNRFSLTSACNVFLFLIFGLDRHHFNAVEPSLGPVMTFAVEKYYFPFNEALVYISLCGVLLIMHALLYRCFLSRPPSHSLRVWSAPLPGKFVGCHFLQTSRMSVTSS